MAEPESLRNRVEWFIEKYARPDDMRALLRECVEDGGLDALVCVRRLYEDMYGGMTFNYELKAPAASTLLIWKELGLKALMEGVEKNPASKNISITLQLLATVAARENLPIFGVVGETVIDKAIQDAITDTPGLARVARSHLVAFILSFPDDDEVAASVGSSLTSLSIDRAASARELFAAVSKRWLALSTPVLNAFDELIGSKPGDEHVFQVFLTRYPQILDPLAVRIWPQPDLFGFKEPDFVVQRADGSYMVVEIECPGKGLATAGGQLTSEGTHAEQQAADYRRYLIRRFSEVEKHFPQLQEPDCLVVVGLERDGRRTPGGAVGFRDPLQRDRRRVRDRPEPQDRVQAIATTHVVHQVARRQRPADRAFAKSSSLRRDDPGARFHVAKRQRGRQFAVKGLLAR